MKPELINSLKHYSFDKLGKDLMSGILVAIIALPLSIALGIQSGVTLQQGVITAIVAGFCISAFGGTKFQIGGPTTAFFAIIATYVSNPNIGILGLQIATIIAGVILLVMGITKCGKLIGYIPYPIVVGFTTGVGITLMTSQFKDFFGFVLPGDIGSSFVQKMIGYITYIDTVSWQTMLVGLFTFAIILIVPKISKKIPSAFVAIILATLLTMLLNNTKSINFNVPTIGSTFGEIKAEIYWINFATIKNIKWLSLIMPAFVIAFLATIESLFSATVADGMTNTNHNSNVELCGLGIGNVASAIFGGLPAIGAIARTSANIKYGAVSPMSGIIHSITLLLMFFLFMPLVKFIPMTSLAAVLVMVAFSMCKFKHFAMLATFNFADTIILLATFALTITRDLVFGIATGAIMTMIFTTYKLIKAPKIVRTSDGNDIIITVTGHITYLSANKIRAMILDRHNSEGVMLDISKVSSIDVSALEKIIKVEKKMHNKNINFAISCTNPKIANELKRASRTF